MLSYQNDKGQGPRQIAHEFAVGLGKCKHVKGRTRPFHSVLCDDMKNALMQAARAGWQTCREFFIEEIEFAHKTPKKDWK